ncbi:hypothetical protein N8T08_010343 [Aspergillus melleus]|uniref:Uncharacterized protein n=1 Tax=Aspergillus melleus TaxID=138277 RepID=A0ACC3ARU3_9EURO|nr:hypothetical protein N8T08_010343 [Aspergillus melleus]
MDTTMDLPISIHDVDPQVLIPALKSHLPYSLPLLRRLQHSLVHPSPTAKCLATASVLDAVGDLKPASDSNSVSDSLVTRGALPEDVGVTHTNTGVPTPWLAAWVDLHAGPETQVVVYSSLEKEVPAPSGQKEGTEEAKAIEKTVSTLDSASNHVSLNANANGTSSKISPDPLDRVRAQLLALLSHIKNRLMPEYLQSLSLNQDLDDNLAPTSARDANTIRIGTSRTASSATDSRPPNPPGQGQGQPVGPSPRAFKIGHLHTGLFSVLTASGKYPPPPPPLGQCQTHTHGFGADASHPHGPQMVVPGLRVHRFDQPPYNKYLFRDEEFVIVDGDPDGDHNSDSDRGDKNGDVTQHDGPRSRSTSGSAPAVTHESNCSQLPPGYRFSDRRGNSALLPRHYELICRRSAVFRTPKSLVSFPGVAVYVDTPSSVSDNRRTSGDDEGEDEENPIAWAFLSADGTLAVLHVEPEHRGKGLAESASREVMRRGMREGGMFRAKGEKGWAHADVAPGNRASCRVMEKLGGVVGWTVTWTVVEFD